MARWNYIFRLEIYESYKKITNLTNASINKKDNFIYYDMIVKSIVKPEVGANNAEDKQFTLTVSVNESMTVARDFENLGYIG